MPAGSGREGGWLLWIRAGTLQAQRLDLAHRALTGDPVSLADGIADQGNLNRSAMAVSPTGLVAYRTGSVSRRQLTWVDRTGRVLGNLGAPDEHDLNSPRVWPRTADARPCSARCRDDAAATPITLIQNWRPDAKK